MANVLHKTADPTDYRISVHTPDYPPAIWFIDPDVSAVASVPTKYWARPLTDPVTEMTQGEKDAVDASEAAAVIAAAKLAAKSLHDDIEEIGRAIRAIVKLNVDELNILRTQWRDFQTETAASINLGSFQTRIATLPSLADRTYAQARTAIGNQIDGE